MEKALTDSIDCLIAEVRYLLKILRKQRKDIRKNCIECSGGVESLKMFPAIVEKCPVKKCPLYKWREGKDG